MQWRQNKKIKWNNIKWSKESKKNNINNINKIQKNQIKRNYIKIC